jgi:UDPglucose 6-dehydrogenase
MRIAIVGTGYVGLVSGACFAELGHQVTCVDKDPKKVAALRAGQMPIYEPGLEDIVKNNVRRGRLLFTTSVGEAVKEARAVFIAVGTPSRPADGHADLSDVYAAACAIARKLTGFTVVITKSTVPVGTGDEIEHIICELRSDASFAVASNPEFLREGAAIRDFMNPDRIVIGTDDDRAKAVLDEIYQPLSKQARLLFTGRKTAELIKYGANAFLATKLTFINEMADLCEKVGADVQDVAEGIGLDNRIGSKYLQAGPGFGGSCFPKDVRALIKTAQDNSVSLRILEAVESINDVRKRAMARKVSSVFSGGMRGKTIAILGLTFKPNTDDMREAPSIPLITALQDMGTRIRVYDPVGIPQAKELLSDVTFCKDAYDCVEEADAVVIVTEWDEFRRLDLERVREMMACPVVVDLRNLFMSAAMQKLGFIYVGVGQPSSFQPAPFYAALVGSIRYERPELSGHNSGENLVIAERALD